MRAEGAFMTLNANCYDVEKYYLKWLRVLNCERGLGFESYVYQLYVVLNGAFLFMLYFNVISDNVILKL